MPRNLVFIFLLLVSQVSWLSAQVREEWVALYNEFEVGLGRNRAKAIAVDETGNVYVTGIGQIGTGSGWAGINPDEYVTIKYDSEGQLIWVVGYRRGYAPVAIAVDTQGSAYVTGSTGGGRYAEYATVKYDAQGNQLWAVQYPRGEANALALDTQGYVYVTGWSWSASGSMSEAAYATIKYDSEGKEVWVAQYKQGGANALAVDTEGNVYVTGQTTNRASLGSATLKYNAEGKEVWVARYYGSRAKALALDSQGNVYVTGERYTTIKYDAEGKEVWVARGGGAVGLNEAMALAVDADDHVCVTGYSGSYPRSDYLTIKYTAEGHPVWEARYHGPGNGQDFARAMALDAEGNIYVTGGSHGPDGLGNYATVKYDAQGQEVWVARYHGPGHPFDEAYALAVDSQSHVYVTGVACTRSQGHHCDSKYATIKYSQ